MRSIRIGFTGTRFGMSQAQKVAFCHVLGSLVAGVDGVAFHHGDCIGADDEAATLVRTLVPGCHIVVHAPADERLRAFNACADSTREAKTHFARNRDIVNECDVLVGTPSYSNDGLKHTGGTAYTLEYGVKSGKRTITIWPDGSTTETNA